eukprot:gnl/TRDRNA2_/TRDRNA2_177159_c3_seq13.p1 gnl/TRDRNA2_/TRDRNA2_177159_c3~~gnl/TRDRNA2_/TRDRNA2_177159_c3_seq13.p1  ORF type:complete len:302 (+),score=38.51 gnl/TRDRNA2_/TRDRNA2_177159_c3_seq13:110-907(+)
MARLKIPIAAASQMAIQQGRGHHHRDRKFTRKCQHGFGEASPSGSGKDARELRIATAVRTINDHLRGLSGEQVGKVVQFLEPDILAMLRKCMSGGGNRVSHDDKLSSRCGHGWIGNGGGHADDNAPSRGVVDSKRARDGGKDDGVALGMISWPLKPEDLPGCTAESSGQVAFQAGMGTPWRLMGRPSTGGARFKWYAQPPDAVSAALKADVRRILSNYARKHSIQLSGANAVKLALRRSEANRAYWISSAGGISSEELPVMYMVD